MKRNRFTEEQIIGILKEHELGAKTADVCRKHGISEATFYKWKNKYGGMDVSEAKRLKALEEENTKLKKLLADAMLDNVIAPITPRLPRTRGDGRRKGRAKEAARAPRDSDFCCSRRAGRIRCHRRCHRVKLLAL
jgi:putative transposase